MLGRTRSKPAVPATSADVDLAELTHRRDCAVVAIDQRVWTLRRQPVLSAADVRDLLLDVRNLLVPPKETP